VGAIDDEHGSGPGGGRLAVPAAAWDALFDGVDERARRGAFVELLVASVGVAGAGLWMRVAGTDAWCEAARVGASDARESIVLAARRSGSTACSALAGVVARGPFGSPDSPWFATVVGLVDDDASDAVDALCAVWDHVRVSDVLTLDELRGARRANDAA
jgi:hypothetical protein